MGFATMLADLHVLIFCNAISYSPGLTFIVQVLYISSSTVFQWADVRAEEYKCQHSSKPYRCASL
ncbi:MAG: hypothetical protein M3004_14815 [Bacteroidota bacterium]|nr:hypothetical protein [Bacteroidota bacterium]